MKFTLNLASRRYVNRRALNHGFLTALVLLFLFCAWSGYNLLGENDVLQTNLLKAAEYRTQLDKLRGGPVKPLTADERSRLEAEFKAANRLLDQDAFRWTRLLDRMEGLVPQGVSLVSFRPDFDKDSLALGGNARSLTEMRQFLDRLMKKGNFEEVLLQNHSRIKVTDYAGEEREAISFSISLQGVF